MAAGSDNIPSTLGADHRASSCTFDPWRCAGELQHSASLRAGRRRHCTFDPWRCADKLQHSAAQCRDAVLSPGAVRASTTERSLTWPQAQTIYLRPLALIIGHHACTFDPWRCADKMQHSAPCRLLPGFLGTPSRLPTALDDAWGGRLSGRSANTQKHRKSRFPGLGLGTPSR